MRRPYSVGDDPPHPR